VVDTSAWIEHLLASPTGDRLTDQLPNPVEWVVPTIVQYELQKWLLRNLDPSAAESVLAFSNECLVVPLTMEIAAFAAKVSIELRLQTADSIIYATARAHDAVLLTCDTHFAALPHVILVPKGAA
jgi:predicted nucleic acid-binding protein